ncbi:MAG TPA: hypothetical protein VLW65_21290 [Bryobacteraceae bacterium]|nr:hypothetical protein [Bryobacteraceae bacterium]
MKKLMTLMLGLAFLGTTVVAFAQSTDTTMSKKKKSKKSSTKTETTKPQVH